MIAVAGFMVFEGLPVITKGGNGQGWFKEPKRNPIITNNIQ